MTTLARPGQSPPRSGRVPLSGIRFGIISAAVGLGLGLLALGPGLRRGFLLSYDMVFVPREPFSAALPGLAPPRAVPSDLVVAAASRVLPADIVQRGVLLAIFVLACSGAAALLTREPVLARLAAGVFYAWNPYVAERLIIGQWALLLGYAGLPWVLRAVVAPDLASWRGARRLGLALLPAIVGGFAAMPSPPWSRTPRCCCPVAPAGRPSRWPCWPPAACRGSSRPCCTRSTSTRPAWPRSRPGPTRRSAASAACSCWAAPGTRRPSPGPTAGRGRRCGWPWSSSRWSATCCSPPASAAGPAWAWLP